MELTAPGRGSYAQRVRDEWLRLLRSPGSRPPRWPTRWVPLLELIALRRRRPRDNEAASGNEAEWQDERGRTRRRADHVAQIMVAAWMGLFSWRRLWSDESRFFAIHRRAPESRDRRGPVAGSERASRSESPMSGPLLERAPVARRAPHGLFSKSSVGPEFGWTSISPSRKIGRRSLLSSRS